MAAVSACEVHNALTPGRLFTQQLALFEARDFSRRGLNVDLAGVDVAFGIGGDCPPYAMHYYEVHKCVDRMALIKKRVCLGYACRRRRHQIRVSANKGVHGVVKIRLSQTLRVVFMKAL